MQGRHVLAGGLVLGTVAVGFFACGTAGSMSRAPAREHQLAAKLSESDDESRFRAPASAPPRAPMAEPSDPSVRFPNAEQGAHFEAADGEERGASERTAARAPGVNDSIGVGGGGQDARFGGRANAHKKSATKGGKDDNGPTAIEQARRLATSTEARAKAPALLARINGPTEEELPLHALRISTVLMGTRSRTLVDCTFGNPNARQLEGTFHVRLPEGASPCYLGMFQGAPSLEDLAALMPPVLEDSSLLLNREIALPSRWSSKVSSIEWATLRPAHVVAQEKAAQVYEQVTRRRVDPAVMEWSGGNTFRTRIFPIMPHAAKRVFFVYDQPPIEIGGQPSVTLAVPEKLPQSFRLEVAASTKAYAKATLLLGKEETPLLDSGSGFFTSVIAPSGGEGTFVLTAMSRGKSIRAGVGKTDGVPGSLVHARLLPQVKAGAARATGDAIFLLDTSLSQRTKLAQSCGRLLREVLANDPSIARFQVIGFDVKSRPVFEGWRKNTDEAREKTAKEVESIWLEGATSIDCGLKAAERALDEGAHATFFLLSDAQVTWGLDDVRELERAHARVFAERWIGYQIGEEAVNRPLLEKLTRRGGRVVNVLSSQDLATASVAHRTTPVLLHGVAVDGVKARDLVVAGRPSTLFPDQVVEVAFRTDEVPQDATIVVDADTGPQRFSLDSVNVSDPVAARAWAETETTALLDLNDKDADEVVVALSQRFAIANRAASFLILETDAEYKAFNLKTEALDLEKLAQLARAKTNRRPVGAPEVDGLDNQALSFLDRIAAVELPAWPVKKVESRDGGFGRTEWAERLEPVAVYKEAARRFDAGRGDEAFRVLTSLIEENPRDSKALRLAAFTLMSWERYEDASSLFGRTRVLRPFEPQAYLGEAFALEALGKTADAALRYELVLAGKFDQRYDDYAKQAARRLYARLLSKIDGKLADDARGRAQQLRLPLDMPKYEAHLLWNLDDTDVDLHVIDPSSRQEVSYQNKLSRTGGQLLWDNTAGLGPEIYTHPTAEPAEMFVNYFGTRSVSGTVPSATLVVFFRDRDVHCRSAVLADQRSKFVLYSAAKD